MYLKKGILGFFVISVLILSGFGLPKNIQKKVDKEFEKIFEATTPITMKFISVPDKINSQLPIKIYENNLFEIFDGKKLLGYAYIDQAPSKTAAFDYLVVFDANLKVIHSKVLIYREEYGGEIGSKRWLKQFLGKTIGDRVAIDDNIDGIAGATISVRSMTNAMDNLLQTITILKKNKIL